MFELRCTVRNCRHTLVLSEDGLKCDVGHHFDAAKGGYWNLTQPQDKKSANPGDNPNAVLARHRWLGLGHSAGLVDALQPWIQETNPLNRILDLGCGDGYFGPTLFPDKAQGFCGIDLSKPAIKLAVKSWPEATWVLANADRGLPVDDSSVDCILSLFGRRPVGEMARALTPQGSCLVAVPGEEDLIELREQIQKEGKRRSRVQAIIDEMQNQGLQCVDQKQWRVEVSLGPDEIADALAMTYRAARKSEQRQVAAIDSEKKVTLVADMMRFQLATL